MNLQILPILDFWSVFLKKNIYNSINVLINCYYYFTIFYNLLDLCLALQKFYRLLLLCWFTSNYWGQTSIAEDTTYLRHRSGNNWVESDSQISSLRTTIILKISTTVCKGGQQLLVRPTCDSMTTTMNNVGR